MRTNRNSRPLASALTLLRCSDERGPVVQPERAHGCRATLARDHCALGRSFSSSLIDAANVSDIRDIRRARAHATWTHGCDLMVTKQSIVAALGEQALALPRLINEALEANDRFKYRLSLLQLARRHADSPDTPVGDLRAERLAAQIDDVELDDLPATCARVAPDVYRLPGIEGLLAAAEHDVRAMLAPVRIAAANVGPAVTTDLEQRVERLLPPLLQSRAGFTGAELASWSRGDASQGDSVHLLVMTLHRKLIELQQAVATEVLDGATVYELAPEDRDLVLAFMRGVNRTSRLRFDHPGLGTTATRHAGRLVIQNDIGETDAHVIVVHIDSDAVSVTYTDVHLQRLLFFQSLFAAQPITWRETRVVQDRQMSDGLYHMAVAVLSQPDRAAIKTFLELLGSRLVFLIDWNRARKQLRMLVSKKESVRVLRWAADNDVGHMGFLRLGGARAVFDAVDFAARGRGRFGQTLDDLLGPERAARFLEYACKTATYELLAGRPESLVHDELRAELVRQLRGSNESLLDLVCDHAGLVVEIATGVRDGLLGLARTDGQEQAETLSARCKAWESDADRLVHEVRESARSAAEGAYLQEIVQRADDVADDLEETSFLVTLLRRADLGSTLVGQLAALAARVVAGSQELVKALEAVRGLGPSPTRDDMRDFLEAIHRVESVEHETDELKRRVAAELASDERTARQIHLAAESASQLELAADHLQHVAWTLRDHVLAQLAER